MHGPGESSPRSRIAALGYLVLTGPLDEWADFATEVVGAAVAHRGDRLEVRVDDRAWRISVEPGEGGLARCGWEVASARDLEALAADLDAWGVTYARDPALAAERGVQELIACADPCGNPVELFVGATVATQAPFVSPTGARFVTSHDFPGDMGVGHIVLLTAKFDEMRRFYTELLGFRVSDGSPTSVFLHVNARHHSLALLDRQKPDAPGPSSLHHFMLEVDDIDDVGRCMDRVEARGDELKATLGRHANDHMISCYLTTPSGFLLEYGTAGRTVDDAVWLPGKYGASLWGHRFRGSIF